MPKRIPRPKAAPSQSKKAVALEPEDGFVRWSFLNFDAHQWRDEEDDVSLFREIATRLKQTESRPWKEIAKNRWRDHYVLVTQMTQEAQNRLREIHFEDFDSLFRFRFEGLERLWGVRSGDYFIVLWWDPKHKVCPSTLKHT